MKYFVANSENLPFENEQFDSVLGNLVLMLADNYENILKETYRLLKPGGIAGFTIWGRKDKCNNWTIYGENLSAYNIPFPGDKSPFALHFQLEKVKETFASIGFKNLRVDYTTLVADTYNSEDFHSKFKNTFVELSIEKAEEDNVTKYLEAVNEIVKARVDGTDTLTTLDVCVLIAFK